MSAAQQGGGELPQDEREAFEAWCKPLWNIDTFPDGTYENDGAYAAWKAWQARAALAQRAASVPAQAGQQPDPDDSLHLCVSDLQHSGIYDSPREMVACIKSVTERMLILLGAPAPAASVQPEFTYSSTQATNCACCGKHKHTPLRVDEMGGYVCLTCIDEKLCGLLGEFGYAQPDIGRDAARYQWMRKTFISDNETWPDDVAEAKSGADLDTAIDSALATQAAPEVASVPDAGDEPVYWSLTYQGEHTANAFRTKESAQATVERLNTAYPGESDSREIVPLYTRPQPAMAVLTNEQIIDICEKECGWLAGAKDEELVKFARAVLAAAAK